MKEKIRMARETRLKAIEVYLAGDVVLRLEKMLKTLIQMLQKAWLTPLLITEQCFLGNFPSTNQMFMNSLHTFV